MSLLKLCWMSYGLAHGQQLFESRKDDVVASAPERKLGKQVAFYLILLKYIRKNLTHLVAVHFGEGFHGLLVRELLLRADPFQI